MDKLHAAALVAVIAAVTIALRFAPFLLLRGRETPKFIAYLGRVLPYAIMGMLVVYCLRGTTFASVSNWLPQLIATAAVVLLHHWKRNTLLSIVAGTALYMVLVQVVF